MSGEALHTTHWQPSTETAIEDWLRRRAFRVPARTPLQFAQLQFHCGTPPPAAEPNPRISKDSSRSAVWRPPRGYRGGTRSTIRDVRVDFHSETQHDSRRCNPFHMQVPCVDQPSSTSHLRTQSRHK